MTTTVALIASTSTQMYGQAVTTLPPAAEEALRRGILATQQEAWPLAIRYFTEAQKLSAGHPSVLFNLGLAHAKAGHEILGNLWLRAYLAAAPQAANMAQVRQEIERLEVSLEARADKIFAEAIAAAEQLPGEFEREYALSQVAQRQAVAGDHRGARRTLGFIQTPKTATLIDFLRALAHSQHQKGDIPGAERTAAEISDLERSLPHRFAPYVKADIVRAKLRSGDIGGALATAERELPLELRGPALVEIAEAQMERGASTEARKTLTAARAVAEKQSDLYEKARVLYFIAELQVEAQSLDEARETARAAVSWAQQLPGGDYRWRKVALLLDLAFVQASAGDLPSAQATQQLAREEKAKAPAVLGDPRKATAQLRAGQPTPRQESMALRADEAAETARRPKWRKWVEMTEYFSVSDKFTESSTDFTALTDLEGALQKIRAKKPTEIPLELASLAYGIHSALREIRAQESELR